MASFQSDEKHQFKCPKQHLLETCSPNEERVCDGCNMDLNVSYFYSCDKCGLDFCKECIDNGAPFANKKQITRSPLIVFSAHGDTCFDSSSCIIVPDSNGGLYFGEMDNFAGVHAMMQAYFSGQLPRKNVSCQVTYGEEDDTDGVDYKGARDVMESLQPSDFVAVIDVTGYCPRVVEENTVLGANSVTGHVVIEKLKHNERVEQILRQIPGLTKIDGIEVVGFSEEKIDFTFEIWHECNDPQADQDETDAYRETQEDVIFLGLPTVGGSYRDCNSSGDYNAGGVFCWKRDIEAMSSFIVKLSNVFVKSIEH